MTDEVTIVIVEGGEPIGEFDVGFEGAVDELQTDAETTETEADTGVEVESQEAETEENQEA